jgi:predicted phosphodiesterase
VLFGGGAAGEGAEAAPAAGLGVGATLRRMNGAKPRPARVAALYDIHGNLPALEAVLGEVGEARVDLVLVGGDVFPGPMPRECLERLLALDTPTRFITGNGDRHVLARMRGIETDGVPAPFRELIRWSGEQIRDYEQVVASWPATVTLDIEGVGAVLFCHATPRNDVDVFTRLTPQERLLPIFEGVGVPLVICGHSHMQFDRIVGRTRVVNAGSVGMSFQGPGAFWLLLGAGVAPSGIELRRTSFDLWQAADRVKATAYPQAEQFAARNILEPPSEAAMLDAFGQIELK